MQAFLETCEDLADWDWILLLLWFIDGVESGGLPWLNVTVKLSELDDLFELSGVGFHSW